MSEVTNDNSELEQQNNFSNVYNYYGEKKILKHLGNIPTFPELFIGRINEVETVHQRLVNNQNILLLVNGKGGIGKTTLASKYYYQYQEYYQHLVWVFSGTSIVDALLTLALPLSMEFPNEANNDQRLTMLLKAMTELNKPCLLIIDNANELTDIQKYHGALLQCSNFHVLLTTRVNKKILNTQLYEVNPLDQKDALLIFKKHYPNHDESEDDLFFSLFQKVNSNTLVIELLAKNLANFNNNLRTKYALSDLLADISNNLLELSKSKKVGTFYQAQSGIQRSETPENIIAAMYYLVKLSADEQKMLSIFAVLPAESIPFQTLEKLILNEDLDNILLALFHKGWLDYDKENGSFRISPVIQEVLRLKNKDLYPYCKEMIRILIEKLKYEPGPLGHLKKISYKEAHVLTHYSRSIVLNIYNLEDNLSILCERIGNYLKVTGDLNNALNYFEKSLSLQEGLYKRNPNNVDYKKGLIISYSKLGEIYVIFGDLNKALDYFEKDFELQKELYEEYPNDVNHKNYLAISYEKLGDTHSTLGNLSKALDYFEKCLRITKKLYESCPDKVVFKNDLAVSYLKLGSIHTTLGNLNKALFFHKRSVKLQKELYQLNPHNAGIKNNLAVSYQFLGITYFELKKIGNALEFFKKYNDLEKELYQKFPENLQFKNLLGISYLKLGDVNLELGKLQEALNYFSQFCSFFEELYRNDKSNSNYKNGLAISYLKLSETHSKCGNMDVSLDFIQKGFKLLCELCEIYPQNVNFRHDLAITYYKFGQFYQKTNGLKFAKQYFIKAITLLSKLILSSPMFAEFQKNLDEIKSALKTLDT